MNRSLQMSSKRYIIVFILMCLLFPGAARAAVPVNLDGCALLLDDNAALLVHAGEYSRIRKSSDGLLTACLLETGKWIVLDESGNPITEEQYDLIRPEGDKLILKKGRHYALADWNFSLLTGWEYSLLLPAGEGYFAFRTNQWDDAADILYLLDAEGEAEPSTRRLAYAPDEMTCGLSKAMSADSGLYGYLGERGEWAVAPSFSACGAFVSGIAAARVSSGVGIIDPDGTWLLSPLYSGMVVGENAILCRERETLYLYRRDEEGLMMVLQYEDAHGALCGDYAAVYTEDYAYLYDLYGSVQATFSAETLLYPGLSGQTIASDRNGMYLYDPGTQQIFGFYDFIQPMPAANAYRVASLDESSGDYSFGVLGEDGSELLEIGYKSVDAPGEKLLAAVDEGAVLVFRIRDGAAEQIGEYPLSD